MGAATSTLSPTSTSAPSNETTMPIAPAPLDPDQIVRLLRSSRLARIAFAVGGEPFVVTAELTTTADARMALEVEDPDAHARIDGRHVAIEVDGVLPTGARWSIVARGTAVARDDAATVAIRHHAIDAGDLTALPAPGHTFDVVPDAITGHLLTRGVVDDWFAGVPAS
jgi:hypothetical protein